MIFEKSWGLKHGLSASSKELFAVNSTDWSKKALSRAPEPWTNGQNAQAESHLGCSFCGILGYSIQSSHR